MTRTLRLAVALAACALVSAVPAVASAEGPTAGASRTCNINGQQRDFPPASYVTSIAVKNTSCTKGKQVTRAYHKCRKSNGGANGRCPNRVFRFRCREGDRSGVPGVQYNARVVCVRGGRRIVSTYTQNV